VHVQLQVPTRISSEQRELLLSLRELDAVGARKSDDKHGEEHHGFFDKIKDVFKHKDE
jgi:DnaJ-class molecular chaperone